MEEKKSYMEYMRDALKVGDRDGWEDALIGGMDHYSKALTSVCSGIPRDDLAILVAALHIHYTLQLGVLTEKERAVAELIEDTVSSDFTYTFHY